ncbi:ABC transporter substrate-binding protein [Paenibacillus sp. NEAU-GSW1]|uniref:ABC transporter substrate-binding protein n=1 Tax=Paenibacillus sp. NEAU-GSW1 TaxID=2682486 RepID=UPI0012E25C5C|nr:extracellular solute-binding protein [Paenibacillus sp. NEAU-GSW1]MUT68778.1 ABC transporter substrate-binding protein [Paenibacillus sp. NEAU-GSW1]
MRKNAAILMSLVLLFSMLAACSGGGGKNEPKGTNAVESEKPAATEDAATAAPEDDIKNRKIKISIYYPLPDQVENRKLEDDKIKRFNEVYPNVEIIKSDWHYNPGEIGIKMAANEAPTFYNTFATEASFLVERGWAADITELYNNYEFKDQINPVLQNTFNIGGKIYGVPQKGYVVTTIVNKKMLDDKGVAVPSYDWTWEDMLNTAKGAADPKKGIAGIAPMGKGTEAGWNWTNFLFQAGGDVQKVEGGKVQATFNSEAGLKALDFYNKLRWDANVIPQDWALGWGDAVGAFAQGRAAMVIAGAEGPLEQALNQGSMKPEDLLTYPMPAVEKGGKHTGVLGGDYLIINPNATIDEQEMAFRYITFDYFSDKGLESLEKDIQARKAEGKYFIPPHINYFSPDSEYGQKMQAIFDKYDNVYKYNDESNSLLDGKPEAQYNTQDYYGAMANVIQEVFSKKGADLQAQLDAAAKLVQEKFFDTIKVE